jgi:hypothetical protein
MSVIGAMPEAARHGIATDLALLRFSRLGHTLNDLVFGLFVVGHRIDSLIVCR